MISGTSYDAVEALAVDIELAESTLLCDLRGHVSIPYSDELRAAISGLLPPHQTTIEEVCRVDTAIGQTFAEVAERLGEAAFDGQTDLVCSHGQTVFHWVEGGSALGTLQLGQPAWIAERTGATVVSDVRSRDLTLGGQGAPLASLLDVLLLGNPVGGARAALNLGGIANITVVASGAEPVAYDTGPANALVDAAVNHLTGGRESYDEAGRRAAAGAVDTALLADLLNDAYYSSPPPKSTGKEHFHLEYLLGHLEGHAIALDDLLATLVALTAETVANELRRWHVSEVFASGGGTRNRTLMRELAVRLPGVAVKTIEEYGIPSAAKEALVFAIVGFLTLHNLPATVASCTGASRSAVLGSITPGRAPLLLKVGEQAPIRATIRTPLVEVPPS
jgi:anhydro-N-acetylmuramic acid kinase